MPMAILREFGTLTRQGFLESSLSLSEHDMLLMTDGPAAKPRTIASRLV